jgi:anti-sigma B factor antagonist
VLSTSSSPNMKGGTKMEEAPNFDIGISHDGTFDIVTVRGEIDLVTAPLLRDAFIGLGSRIIVDLRTVSFMDSSGLAVLIQQKSQMEGGELRIVADGSAVLRLFQLSGLTDFFEPTPDLVLPPKTKPKFQSS